MQGDTAPTQQPELDHTDQDSTAVSALKGLLLMDHEVEIDNLQ